MILLCFAFIYSFIFNDLCLSQKAIAFFKVNQIPRAFSSPRAISNNMAVKNRWQLTTIENWHV